MAESSTSSGILTRSDRWGLVFTVVGGLVVAVAALADAVWEIARILPNKDVAVQVPFVDMRAPLPVGPDGAPVDAVIDTATVQVSGMAGITLVSLILAHIAVAATVLALVGCGVVLCRNLARGIAFSRTNTRMIIASSVIVTAGWFAVAMFGTMGVNGAFAALSDYTYDNVTFAVDWAPVFVALALAVIGMAFQAGERLQKDAEGLV
ncbi:DUF2975 domain-containing protein [Rhodococcus triatomae]|uniref:DUF2975 domain-containing protein n=1 Tax=Rhodococcus triatomae TaxID=300028 RepID=A0A1G8GIW6_9NOCA|nr:DUF2975 domain-containing protein [Rhodococcus triatomae]QNG20365.1 DUF2975 domain-containing protein [Rhodococcus triatomae]QNG23719.1 DUF2975 domain-containing protein [Rhodococcus triatomae]SDH94302.1 Protein of unknown function [Rhodococcus triatomae]